MKGAKDAPAEAKTNTVKCTKCGADVKAGSKFCPECGTQLPEQTVDTLFAALDNFFANAKFCPECGKKLN